MAGDNAADVGVTRLMVNGLGQGGGMHFGDISRFSPVVVKQDRGEHAYRRERQTQYSFESLHICFDKLPEKFVRFTPAVL